MRKQDKLYTVNKWNRPLFMPEKNLFYDGGNSRADYANDMLYGASPQSVNTGQANFVGTKGINLSNFRGLSGNALTALQDQNKQQSLINAFNVGKTGNAGGQTTSDAVKSGFKGAAMQAAGATALNALGSIDTGERNGIFDTLDPVYHLAGGRESGVGNALSDTGVSLTKSGNPWLMLAGAGLKIVGGLTNAAFGIKEDKAKKAAADQSIKTNSNFLSNANSFDAIKGPASMTNTNIYEGGWFSGGKADDKNEDYAKQMANAYSWADRSVLNNIYNLSHDQIANFERNYSAFGGPIEMINDNDNMGAIGYGFMSDYLSTKKKQADSKNQMTNLFAGTPSSMFAIGGDLQTNGADYSTGLTHINAGGSHESSPYDGVQMGVDSEGTPNLVEEGEVVYNDYVYSARIPIDQTTKEKFHFPKKKEITYADAAKKLEKEIAERPNDPLSQAGFKAQMETLAEEQERQKAEMEAARAREAFEALSPEEQTAIMQRAAQEEAIAQQAAQEQAIAEQQAIQQPTPEQAAMMQADGSQAMISQEPQMQACGGKINKYAEGGYKKNAGSWKKGTSSENWQAYTKNGLRDYLLMINDKLAEAETDDDKKKIREEAIKTVNDIQKAYAEAYQSNLSPSEKSEKVEALQKAFEKAGGNAYFGGIANNINLPKGHNTADTEEKGWVDGYWGPRTSIRNWGSTEYGDADYYKDIAELAQEAGLTYTPGQYKYGDNTLYELGLAPEEVAAVEAEPEAAWDYGDATSTRAAEEVTTTQTPAAKENKEDVPNYKAEWPRYAGLFGPTVGLGLQLAGVGKPDYSGIDAAIAAANSPANLADYQPIGDYLRYRPMDIWYEQNRLNANARATDRAIMNSGVNQGSKNAALLASGYNDQLASGDLYRKALEYNDALRERVAAFNRGTNQFNADAYNRTSQFNADARNRAKQFAAQIGLQGASQRLDADAGWYNSLYGNISGLFKGLSDLGKENAQHNMIAKMWADGIPGSATHDTYTASDYLKEAKKRSKGGKNRKKHDIIL